jgi:prevent-host-death family protein
MLDEANQGTTLAGMAATVVNVYEAKTNFSRLLDRVARGEEIIIARAGHPVARLVPFTSDSAPRTPGGWRGRVRMSADFDALPDDVAAALRGERS